MENKKKVDAEIQYKKTLSDAFKSCCLQPEKLAIYTKDGSQLLVSRDQLLFFSPFLREIMVDLPSHPSRADSTPVLILPDVENSVTVTRIMTLLSSGQAIGFRNHKECKDVYYLSMLFQIDIKSLNVVQYGCSTRHRLVKRRLAKVPQVLPKKSKTESTATIGKEPLIGKQADGDENANLGAQKPNDTKKTLVKPTVDISTPHKPYAEKRELNSGEAAIVRSLTPALAKEMTLNKDAALSSSFNNNNIQNQVQDDDVVLKNPFDAKARVSSSKRTIPLSQDEEDELLPSPSLKKVRKVSSDECNYGLECQVCGVKFKIHHHLACHMVNRHFKKEVEERVSLLMHLGNECTMCGDKFKSQEYLVSHLGCKHGFINDVLREKQLAVLPCHVNVQGYSDAKQKALSRRIKQERVESDEMID